MAALWLNSGNIKFLWNSNVRHLSRRGWVENSTTNISALMVPPPTSTRGAPSHLASSSNTSSPREFYGAMRQVKASPQKMNLVARLIRGMKIRDALAQLHFSPKRPATYILSTVQDTQRRAVETYGADPLNLYVAESYVGKGQYLKRIRYHGRGMHGIMHKTYAHYFLVLREGLPPPKKKKNKEDMKKFLTKKLINRGPLNVPNSL